MDDVVKSKLQYMLYHCLKKKVPGDNEKINNMRASTCYHAKGINIFRPSCDVM